MGAVKSLLKAGADVNAKDKDCNTPLMLAASKGHADILDFILDKFHNNSEMGVALAEKNSKGEDALVLARQNGNPQLIAIIHKNRSGSLSFLNFF